MKSPVKYDSYIALGLALASGLIAWGSLTARINADEQTVANLQLQQTNVEGDITSIKVDVGEIDQSITDIDNHVK